MYLDTRTRREEPKDPTLWDILDMANFFTSSIDADRAKIIAAAAAVDPDKAIRVARFFSYPKQAMYLIASFIALVSICHHISLVYRYARRARSYPATTSHRAAAPRMHRLPTALADSAKALAFRWTVPLGPSFQLNIVEVFVTAAYIAVLFTWTLINTTSTTGVIIEPHYYANRAGTIAASQLPIMTALGMRNNLISWLTGISFDKNPADPQAYSMKLNYLHRTSARVICVLVWLHGGGRLAVGLVDDEAVVNRWVQCGFLAASTLTLMCIFTVQPVRKRSYEFFLLIHFIFAFIFIMSVYFHLTGRSLTYYGAWPSMIIWGIDRFIRLVQLVLYNYGYFSPASSPEELDASVELLSPHFLRVTMYRPKYFYWRPGQSAFLAFPTVSKFPFKFESHPFTIATIAEEAVDPESGSETKKRKLVFFVRVRNGFTKRLKETVEEKEGRMKVFVNGPYSTPPILVGYQSVILVAGGSGVAFTLPLLMDLPGEANILAKILLSFGPSGTQASSHGSCLMNTKLVNNNDDIDHIKWIGDIALPALENVPESISVQMKFFVTTALENPQTWEGESNESMKEKGQWASSGTSSQTGARLLELPFASMEHGRPDVTKLIQEEVRRVTGPLSINVCGTDRLANSVREAIRAPRFGDVVRGEPSIDLHVEAFGGS
ncbi:hypothetical protein D9613_011676 [Agrocybe pediades]|uniref:FAD-binding FR-type domain-containing protein n=1 Tax=Agrocybe pediades TaxID=84607 RepID=A0A8H4VQC5_9AGAR|nr:hypothetical protein D9613_011676 [Agrocybe pediades]